MADHQSRSHNDSNDYSLSCEAFKELILCIPFQLKVDLFASRLSHKLPLYASWKFDPFAWKVNAFSFTWPNNVYFFPPINLITKSVHKFVQDEVKLGVLITPDWSGITILPKIISLLVADPIFIPSYYFEGQIPTRHPFNLMAWPISTPAENSRSSLRKQQTLSWRASPPLLGLPTSYIGNTFTNMLLKRGINVKFLYQ